MSLTQCDTARTRIWREFLACQAWLRALELTAPIASESGAAAFVRDRRAGGNVRRSASSAFRRRVHDLSLRSLSVRTNVPAGHFEQGLAKGDTVCLIMPNRPEYMAIWLGITRTGCAVALVNTNLTGPSLAHSVNIVAPKHIIVAAELVDRLTSALPYFARRARSGSTAAATPDSIASTWRSSGTRLRGFPPSSAGR